MPAVLDDPSTPVRYRTFGSPPYPTQISSLPFEIAPRQVTLRDRVTAATLVPFSSPEQVPNSLLNHLCSLLNKEIEDGDTYPMTDLLSVESFGTYWFANFGAIMLLGDIGTVDDLLHNQLDNSNWDKCCLGSFYIKPNYPGRSSHVCNGGFLVSAIARNRGVGRLMGEGYLEWAPKLGYTYSVFNLVYETNVASCRIWDGLGFKRIGRVKGCGNLKSYPDQLVDAIIYGRDLGEEEGEYASEDRFDKIRFYLREGKYPQGSDRAEKSRLRSAATHYKLVAPEGHMPEKLMLKDKEVISNPTDQHEIAVKVHSEHHAGINKSTATIAEKYHWIGIKGTVSQVIRNCAECRDVSRASLSKPEETVIRDGKGLTSDITLEGDLDQGAHHQGSMIPPNMFQENSSSTYSGLATGLVYPNGLVLDPQLIRPQIEYQSHDPQSSRTTQEQSQDRSPNPTQIGDSFSRQNPAILPAGHLSTNEYHSDLFGGRLFNETYTSPQQNY